MKWIVPNFYDDFSCIASKCKDNCCVGWEIDIDKNTYDKYKNITTQFKSELNDGIINNDKQPYFKLINNRCAMLNGDNLCNIILNCGDEYLCDICDQHPRFHHWFANQKESGLGICCEEVCRILLTQKFDTILIEKEIDEISEQIEYNKEQFNVLYYSRNIALDICNNKNFSVCERCILLIDMSVALQGLIDSESYCQAKKICEQFTNKDYCTKIIKNTVKSKNYKEEIINILNFLLTLEVIDENWHLKIKAIIKQFKNIEINFDVLNIKNEFSNDFEKLLWYFVYRYYLEDVYTDEIISSVCFSVISALIISIFNVFDFTIDDLNVSKRINNAKEYSKEVEYSQDNVDAITNAVYDNKSFNPEILKSICKSIT